MSGQTIIEPSADTSADSLPGPGHNPVRRRRRLGIQAWKGAGFTAPFFLGFALLFLLPFGYALYQSLFLVQTSGCAISPRRCPTRNSGPRSCACCSSPACRSRSCSPSAS
jgi:hypothetical protein